MRVSSTRLAVRVTPRAGSDEVVGWAGAELEVRVKSAPDAGKANSAVCELIASAVGVAKSRVSVLRGGASRHKMLLIEGLDAGAVTAALGGPQGE
ncbi:MAG TPA: DUF167 domain-containing protein [Coriobacteriia bacterium]